MARFYEIVKHNAQKFADERNCVVYIAKAKRKTDYEIWFSADESKTKPNYEIFEEVYPSIKGATHMKRKFRVDANKKIQAANRGRVIRAAEDSEFEDPRIDQVEELKDIVDEDFEYVMSGIERLSREGLLDDAIELLTTLSGTLDSAVGIIGDKFESDNINDKEI